MHSARPILKSLFFLTNIALTSVGFLSRWHHHPSWKPSIYPRSFQSFTLTLKLLTKLSTFQHYLGFMALLISIHCLSSHPHSALMERVNQSFSRRPCLQFSLFQSPLCGGINTQRLTLLIFSWNFFQDKVLILELHRTLFYNLSRDYCFSFNSCHLCTLSLLLLWVRALLTFQFSKQNELCYVSASAHVHVALTAFTFVLQSGEPPSSLSNLSWPLIIPQS